MWTVCNDGLGHAFVLAVTGYPIVEVIKNVCVVVYFGARVSSGASSYLLKRFSLKAYFSSLPKGVRLSCPASRKAVIRIPSHSEP